MLGLGEGSAFCIGLVFGLVVSVRGSASVRVCVRVSFRVRCYS